MSKDVRVIANWKMHKTIDEAIDFVQGLRGLIQLTYIAMPSTILYAVSQKKPPMVTLGAQNIYFESQGPFTGEVSAEMVKDAGAEFVILGHSERRMIFHEDNSLIHKKIKHALHAGLQVILCVGETLSEREAKTTADVLKKQVLECLLELTDEELSQITLAYEPIWAIGSGSPATAQMAQETHAMLRALISEQWGAQIAENLYIIYGGSTKPNNVQELVEQKDIDGVLVGAASLDIDTFMQIIQNAGKINS